MKNKPIILNKQFIALTVFAVMALIIVIIAIAGLRLKPTDDTVIQKSEADNIEVTVEELEEYRQNIGNSMDIKKSILIIFNSADECQEFIDEYGNNDNILALNKGIFPQLQEDNGEQYYNTVGNTVFEQLFDSMQDGEYLKTPVEFGGAYCYFKRLENYSILNNDKDLKAFISSEKSIEKGGKIE